jgi:hypothetical protein
MSSDSTVGCLFWLFVEDPEGTLRLEVEKTTPALAVK